MKTKRFILLAVAASALSACSFDNRELEYGTDSPVAFGVTTSLGVTSTVTRGGGATADLQSTQLNESSTPAVYVVKHSTSSPTYDNHNYANIEVHPTPSVSGNSMDLMNTTTTTSKQFFYFPQDKTSVDVYVYAPRKDTSPSLTAMPISVQPDQSTDANYLASDFVFGKTSEVAYNTSTVSVQLYHALSKLKLIIKDAQNEQNVTGIKKITLGTNESKILLDANVNLDGTVTENKTGDILNHVSMTSSSNETNDAVVTTKSSGSEGIITFFEDNSAWTANKEPIAVIPPQVLTNKTFTIDFGGDSNKYTGTFGDLTLAAATEYTITITLNQGTLDITTVSIAPWATGADTVSVE